MNVPGLETVTTRDMQKVNGGARRLRPSVVAKDLVKWPTDPTTPTTGPKPFFPRVPL